MLIRSRQYRSLSEETEDVFPEVTDTNLNTPSTDSESRDETPVEDPPAGDSNDPPDDNVPRYPERVRRQPDRYGH